MTQNNDLLSSELNKWTKSMLVDYIVAQTLPAGVKLSDDLSKFLKDSSSDPVSPSHGNSINIANTLQSVVEELKSVALNNAKLHDKLNHLNAAPNAQTPKFVVHPNLVTGTRSTQPTNQLTASQSSSVKSKFIVGFLNNSSSKLSSVPVCKHVDIFVSRLDPSVTTALLESELFNGYSDVTISKMVSRHPSYSSFYIRLPADKLDIVLDPAFWPDGVMVKRFWVWLRSTHFQIWCCETPQKLISQGVKLPMGYYQNCRGVRTKLCLFKCNVGVIWVVNPVVLVEEEEFSLPFVTMWSITWAGEACSQTPTTGRFRSDRHHEHFMFQIWFWFVHYNSSLFHQTILNVEGDTICATEAALEYFKLIDTQTHREKEIFLPTKNKEIPVKHLEIVCQFVLSLPGTSAPIEKLFSQINKYWTSEKSQLHIVTTL
ncbi:Reverse transcriptase domain-containing protein, partial [Aphis craccivora]